MDFWLLEAADLDEALVWGRKAAVACRAPVEVRQVWSGSPKQLNGMDERAGAGWSRPGRAS